MDRPIKSGVLLRGVGGVRELIDRANSVTQLGSGSPSFRADEEVYTSAVLVGADTNTAENPNADLDAFFDEQFISASDAPSEPGQRSCSDIGYNLLCNSIYSLDDPDDYCRQARAWINDEERFANACLYRENDHDPCLWLSEELEDIDNIDSGYFPDPRQDAFVCDTHGAYLRDQHNHGRDYTTHQRAFNVDSSRRAYESARDSEPSYGYALTRFSLANKDSHVSRLYSKLFAPFYCPSAGVEQADQDCDGVPDTCDNCPRAYNPAQVRSGATVEGDACLDAPDRIDRRCVAPIEIDPGVCEGCEELDDPDLGLSGGDGCQCGTTTDSGSWFWFAMLAVVFTFRRAKRRRRHA